MGTFATVALVICGISFMTFVTFFGRLPALRYLFGPRLPALSAWDADPPPRRTPIAWLHRLIWIYIPNGVLALDQRLTSGKLTSSIARFGNYIMYDRHPTVLVRLSLSCVY